MSKVASKQHQIFAKTTLFKNTPGRLFTETDISGEGVYIGGPSVETLTIALCNHFFLRNLYVHKSVGMN